MMRKIRSRCDTPAIAHTGEFEIENRAVAAAAGFVAHVQKPDGYAQLPAIVRRLRKEMRKSSRLHAVA
jgi:CheY-like chemotaxis protein